MKFIDIANNYLKGREGIEIKKGTVEFYRSKFIHINNYLKSIGIEYVDDITYDVIIDYIKDLRITNSANSVNKYVGALKRCLAYSDIIVPGIDRIKKLKEKIVTFDMFTDDEVRAIINYAKKLPEDVGNNLMYKAIILLLLDTGVRRSELKLLQHKNVDLNDFSIYLVQTKTDQNRYVYFLPDTAEVVKKLLDKKMKHPYLLHNYLKDRPINLKDIDYLMRKLREDLNLKKCHAHMFRHTMLSNWVLNGADLKTVSKVSGHANMAVLDRYQHRTNQQVKNIYAKTYKR